MRVEIAMMRTPDGHSRLELSRFLTPPAVADHRKARAVWRRNREMDVKYYKSPAGPEPDWRIFGNSGVSNDGYVREDAFVVRPAEALPSATPTGEESWRADWAAFRSQLPPAGEPLPDERLESLADVIARSPYLRPTSVTREILAFTATGFSGWPGRRPIATATEWTRWTAPSSNGRSSTSSAALSRRDARGWRAVLAGRLLGRQYACGLPRPKRDGG